MSRVPGAGFSGFRALWAGGPRPAAVPGARRRFARGEERLP